VAGPRARQPKPSRPRPSARPRRAGPGGLRVAVALLLVLAGVSTVVWLVVHLGRQGPRPVARHVDVEGTVREVAARHKCGPERVVVREGEEAGTRVWSVTIHAPRGLDAEGLALDLQAAAHNLGGRLEPLPLAERGGYGLARLEGVVDGERWRVLVLGEAPPPRRTPRLLARPPAGQGSLAIVLDDAGYSLDPVAAIGRLPKAVAVAVIPNAPLAREVARALGAQGRELLVHMPMEALPGNGPDPGPGAIEVGLPAAEIARRIDAGLAAVPGAVGLNNHMGSRATADRSAMEAVMEALKGRHLFFLDSRTTADTVAEDVARENGVAALRRDVFLDVVAEPAAIRAALGTALARARSEGRAVAIGHVHPITLEVLAAELSRPLEGVRLVPPTRLLREGR
jgi:polysaccharide deacetylase 2 family uncharacterized protein YibQ